MTDTEVFYLGKSQINKAGRLLGRAFYNYPAYTYIIPKEGTKREYLIGWLCSVMILYSHIHGHVYTATSSLGNLKGISVWIPPGYFPTSIVRMILLGMYASPFKLGLSSFIRSILLMNSIEKYHNRDMRGDHWYLFLLGVEPTDKGQGIGSSLLQDFFRKSDAQGLPYYLETFKEKNVYFYQKHGFEVIAKEKLLSRDLHCWTMKRIPKIK